MGHNRNNPPPTRSVNNLNTKDKFSNLKCGTSYLDNNTIWTSKEKITSLTLCYKGQDIGVLRKEVPLFM